MLALHSITSTYHVTELVHLEAEGDEAILILFVVVVDELFILFIHGLAVRILLAIAVLFPVLCLWAGCGELRVSHHCDCDGLYVTQSQAKNKTKKCTTPLARLYLKLVPLAGGSHGHEAGEHEDFHLWTQDNVVLL